MVSNQGNIFTSEAFAKFLRNNNIKHRLEAVGKHGSIAVTERVNKTLKYEWLKRVAIIKGINHLTELCRELEIWYNGW